MLHPFGEFQDDSITKYQSPYNKGLLDKDDNFFLKVSYSKDNFGY